MQETPLLLNKNIFLYNTGSNYLFYITQIKNIFFICEGMVKMLLTWGQFAWVNNITHQRLNVEHPSINKKN